ncbi:MAG: ABC transporter permease [Gammaproteobacteria bacterium]|nr:ABC transporter permease [Gammaproteobacteria bacterium]
MSPDKTIDAPNAVPDADATGAHAQIGTLRGAWRSFRRQRLSYWSAIVFAVLFLLSLCAELIANHRPLLVRYDGALYSPLLIDYPETVFGGVFETPTDYTDPFIQDQFARAGNWAVYAPIRYQYNTINFYTGQPNPAPPSAVNWLGTDNRGRDVLARLIYAFRVSVLFALGLALLGSVAGVIIGALQGYFGGRVDLYTQRVVEIWSSMPELYLLIIFNSLFEPSLWLLLVLLSLFGWMSLSEYMRAEFLRGRNMMYVTAARALGVSHLRSMSVHILPNSLAPIITFLPFRFSGAVLVLTSLDFLGLGVPSDTPSLGELLSQGKENLEAWWLSLSGFFALVILLLLMVFIGEGLRNAVDPHHRRP